MVLNPREAKRVRVVTQNSTRLTVGVTPMCVDDSGGFPPEDDVWSWAKDMKREDLIAVRKNVVAP